MYMSQMTICLLIFLFMAVAFFTNKIPMCFTSMIVLLLLVFTGCVDGKEAIATFGSSTVIKKNIFRNLLILFSSNPVP